MKTLAAFLLIAIALVAHSERQKLTFEIVSIKPHKSGDDPTRMPLGLAGGRYTAANVHLRQLIVAAYVDSVFALQGAEVDGIRGWDATDGFDVQAQTEAGLPPT